MKRILSLLLLVGLCAQAWAADAFEVQYYKKNTASHQLDFTLGNYSVKTKVIDGKKYSFIATSQQVKLNKKGYAELPYMHASVALANNHNVHLQVTDIRYQEIELDFPLLPSRGTIYRNQHPENIPYEIDPASITNSWYPAESATTNEPYILRDVRGINVFFQAFQYNAAKKVLRVATSMTVELIENNEVSTNPLPVSAEKPVREMRPIYNSLFVNMDNNRQDLIYGESGEMLVIYTERDADAIAPFIQWKKENGFVVATEEVSTGTNVKNLIKTKYDENNNLLYVQLVGDWNDIKCDLGGGANAPMDPQLGCVVGTDKVADIFIGRFSGESPADITTQVDKSLDYEKNPELDADWYKASLGIGSAEGASNGDDSEMDKEHQEVIYNDKLDPFTYDQQYTAYDPGASASMVATAVNEGVSVINYTGHGSNTSWGTTGFSNSNVNQLTNENRLPIVYSVACVNGAFHSGTCFAEAWLRKVNGGAVAMLASTINQPWQPPMRGQDYMMDLIIGGYNYDDHPQQNGINTEEQRTILGSIVFNSFHLMTSESQGGDDWETVETWTIFGDASLQVRTAAPETVNLSNTALLVGAPFETTVSAAGPVAGAKVSISKDGLIYTGTTDASGQVSIAQELTPGTARLVVTGFNLATIYQDIEVIPPTGPYVLVASSNVDDSEGNNNGLADFGETIKLDVNLKNVGVETAVNVSAELSTTNSFVTITDASETYGDIAPDAIVEAAGAYTFELANNIPDQTAITFDLAISGDGSDGWNAPISVMANAPVLATTEMLVDDSDSGDGNGILDAGETATLKITVANTGHATASDIAAAISTTASELSVDNGSFSISSLEAEATAVAEFTVTAADDVPLGTPVVINFTAEYGAYNTEENLSLIIGEIPVILMATGTQTLCAGRFYDSGGENGDYANNENITMTFIPSTEGARIRMNFDQFNVESGYDYLYIYDGSDVNAPQVAGSPFDGTTPPPEIIADNDAGTLTIKFTSDGYVSKPGWAADITCYLPVGFENQSTTQEIQIFPNPAKDFFQIANAENANIAIYNLMGEMVSESHISSKLGRVNTSALPAGNYIIRIVKQEQSITRKLILN